MHLQHLSKHKTNYILLTGEHQPTLMELRWMYTIPFTISMLLLLRQNVTIVQLICIIRKCLYFHVIINVANQMILFESFRIVCNNALKAKIIFTTVARENRKNIRRLCTLISTHFGQRIFYKISYTCTYTP